MRLILINSSEIQLEFLSYFVYQLPFLNLGCLRDCFGFTDELEQLGVDHVLVSRTHAVTKDD